MQLIAPVLEFVKTVAIIVLIAFFVRFYLVQPFVVDGSSMEPKLHNGQYLLVDKVSYRFKEPARGDIIVFHPPSAPGLNYIKRIIALPGEEIAIRNGEIYVNNVRLTEPYIPEDKTLVRNSQAANLKQKLGPDEYFVLGDNRDHSSDSREWGNVPIENVIGKAWLVVFPIKSFGLVFQPQYGVVPATAQVTGQ